MTIRRALVCGLVVVLFGFLVAAPVAAEEDSNPLRPADTSSPRATLKSFLTNTEAALQVLQEAVERGRRHDARDEVRRSLDRAGQTLDLSGIAPALRRQGGLEAVILLREVLDRIPIPDFFTVPGLGSAEDEAPGAVSSEGVRKWTIPDTEISIVRIDEGPRAGEYLFSSDTVSRLREFFEKSKEIDPVVDRRYRTYEIYVTHAGSWIDEGLISSLPWWLKHVVGTNPIWRWVLASITLVVAAALVYAVIKLGYRFDVALENGGRRKRYGRMLALIVCFVMLEFAQYMISEQVFLTGRGLVFISTILTIVLNGIVLWFIWLLMDQIAQLLIGARGLRQRSVDAHMVRVTFRILTIVIIIFVAVTAAEELGVPLAPVLASLGVGGLAVALAARPTLENVIGGLILFSDRPVRVGDFFRWGDQVGTVEEIGLRSTRIRTLDRTLVTIPNADFSGMQLENFQVRDMILWMTKLHLRRDTTPDQLQYVLAKFREMLIAHPMVHFDPARVRVIGFGEHSIELDVFVYVKTSDINVWFGVIEDILLRMMRILDEGGTSFSLPMQIHPPPSFGYDPERARVAESWVEKWRQDGRLPFPQFADSDLERVSGNLDFPPKGSPDFKPSNGPAEALPPALSEAGADAGFAERTTGARPDGSERSN